MGNAMMSYAVDYLEMGHKREPKFIDCKTCKKRQAKDTEGLFNRMMVKDLIKEALLRQQKVHKADTKHLHENITILTQDYHMLKKQHEAEIQELMKDKGNITKEQMKRVMEAKLKEIRDKLYTEEEILKAIKNSYERNQFNETYFWSNLKHRELVGK